MIRQFIITITLLSISTFCFAVDIQALNPVETIEIKPKGFKSSIKYNITLPHNYGEELDKKYFVLFDMHPRSQPYISGMHDWMSHNGEWPWLKTIIVTPADYNPEFAATFNRLVDNPNQPEILDIIQQGIMKEVDERYRTNGFKIYNGFMSNGALGLFTLLNRPDMFDAYFVASPTLNNNFANVLTDASHKLQKKHSDIKFLYMTIGNHHYEKAHIESFKRFEGELQKLKNTNLEWHSSNNEDNYYMSRPVITLLKGIEALFNDIHHDLPADSEISQRGVDSIVEYYEKLSSKKYGFKISAEGSLKLLAKSLLDTRPTKAIDIYIKTTELYPDSAYAHASLAKAYAVQGKIQKAIEVQTTALDKASSMSEWHQNKHQQYLDEYKGMSKK